MNDDGELSADQRTALRDLRQDAMPPAHIEEAVVEALRRQGLGGRPHRRWVAPTVAAAAMLVGFLAGLWVFRDGGDRGSATSPRFVLLLYAGDGVESSPNRHEEYALWARTVSAQGTVVSGDELAEGVEEIAIASQPQPVPAQPRGYFVISARDLVEARRIAATCPHLRHGGRIVLRRVVS